MKENKNWKTVSEEELIEFINNYPHKLEQDAYMDSYYWFIPVKGRQSIDTIVATQDWWDNECRICSDDILEKIKGESE